MRFDKFLYLDSAVPTGHFEAAVAEDGLQALEVMKRPLVIDVAEIVPEVVGPDFYSGLPGVRSQSPRPCICGKTGPVRTAEEKGRQAFEVPPLDETQPLDRFHRVAAYGNKPLLPGFCDFCPDPYLVPFQVHVALLEAQGFRRPDSRVDLELQQHPVPLPIIIFTIRLLQQLHHIAVGDVDETALILAFAVKRIPWFCYSKNDQILRETITEN